MFDETGAQIAFFQKRIELSAAHFDNRKFAGDEERVQSDECGNGCQFSEDHHRRTLYTFIKRNAPHPEMAIFDVPDRGTTVVRRQTSNTPLQALVLLDDPQYVEAYRVLAANVLKGSADPDAQLTTIFRLATRRRPSTPELARLRTYYDLQLRRYADDEKAAAALLASGVTPVPTAIDKRKLAALTNVTAVIMNTPDAYTLR